ncbi:MAG: CHAT domain-containing protein [Leptolyngbyaceae cyanobacterium RU_5_1]|nr:CHAT domain-containing protein [Leptolyngbyaceae cyanobacterium RU_5_1]
MSRRHSLRYLIALALSTLLTAFLCSAVQSSSPSGVIAPAQAKISPQSAPSPSTCIDVTLCTPTLLADSSRMQQGKALYESGKFADAIAVLQQAVQRYQRQGDSLRQAIALSNLSLAHQQLGQWNEANQAITESLRLLRSGEKPEIRNLSFLAHALEIQGNVQLETGQAEQAIAIWQQAELVYKRLNDANGIAKSQINQAQALRVLGYYRRALTMLTELRQTFQTQPDSIAKAVELRSLGNALRLVGDPEQSYAILQQALTLAKRLQSAQEISTILFGLGNTARSQQNTQAAITFYQNAATSAPTAINKIQAQINLFSLLIDTNQQSTAQSLLPDIQTQLETLPSSQSSIYARIRLAQSLMKWQQIKAEQRIKTDETNGQLPLSASSVSESAAKSAAKLLSTAIQHARILGDRRAESGAIGSLGSVYEQTGQWQDAQKLTQQALNLAQGLNAPDLSYRWHWQLGRLLKQQGNITGAIAAYDAAVGDLRSLRGDLVAVNREVQFSFRESVEPVYRESVELLVQTQAGESTEQNLDKARQRIEALQLAELDNFFREACLDTRTVLLDKVVDQDNPTAAIIYPIILPNQLDVIVKLPKRSLHHHTIKIPKQDVEHLLQQLQQNLTELDATDTVQTLSQQVYRWLIEPIEPDLDRQGVNTLVFVLDGAFRSIPMAGLYTGQHYLVEKYAVALSIGLQLLPPKALVREPLNVLAAGLVEPPLQFQQQFPPLPEIKSEFNLIAKTGIATQQLLDQAFTSQALAAKVNSVGFNVVHLATHGQFSSQAKDTFILAADGPINVTQLDSLLRSRSQSRSTAIELLVLSACQTAEGDDRAILGLAGVAVKAGARSTLASLWQIDDRSTAILIGEFYRELASRQVTKAEALRRAQLVLLKNYPNYDRPGYWAAYVLVGNWL